MMFVVVKNELNFLPSESGDAYRYCGFSGLDEPQFFTDIDNLTDAVNIDRKANGWDEIPTYDEASIECCSTEEYFSQYGINAAKGYLVSVSTPYAVCGDKKVAESFVKENCGYFYAEVPSFGCPPKSK